MDLVHPVMKKMLTIGCTSQVRTMLAFQTYMDLCELFVMYEVDYSFNSSLNIIYITTKDKSRLLTSVYVPVLVSENVCHEDLQSWIATLKEVHGENTELYVCLRDVDSTASYHKISDGMVTPLSLEATEIKNAEEESTNYVRQVVYNMRKDLYDKLKSKPEESTEEL